MVQSFFSNKSIKSRVSAEDQLINRLLLKFAMNDELRATYAVQLANQTAAAAASGVATAPTAALLVQPKRERIADVVTKLKGQNDGELPSEDDVIREMGEENAESLMGGREMADAASDTSRDDKDETERDGLAQQLPVGVSQGVEGAQSKQGGRLARGVDNMGQRIQRMGERGERLSNVVGKTGERIQKGNEMMGSAFGKLGDLAGGTKGNKLSEELKMAGRDFKKGGTQVAKEVGSVAQKIDIASKKVQQAGKDVSESSHLVDKGKKLLKKAAAKTLVMGFNKLKSTAVVADSLGLSLIAAFFVGHLVLLSPEMARRWKIVIGTIDLVLFFGFLGWLAFFVMITCGTLSNSCQT